MPFTLLTPPGIPASSTPRAQSSASWSPSAVGRFDGVTEAFAGQLRIGFADLLKIVQELEEHDPGEHGQTVKIAVEPFVFAHDVARGLDQATKLLGGGQGNLGFHISDLRFQIADLMYQTELVRIGGGDLAPQGKLLDPYAQRF